MCHGLSSARRAFPIAPCTAAVRLLPMGLSRQAREGAPAQTDGRPVWSKLRLETDVLEHAKHPA